MHLISDPRDPRELRKWSALWAFPDHHQVEVRVHEPEDVEDPDGVTVSFMSF